MEIYSSYTLFFLIWSDKPKYFAIHSKHDNGNTGKSKTDQRSCWAQVSKD